MRKFNSITRIRLLSVFITMFMLMIVSVSPVQAGLVDPQYSTLILDPALQPKWVNGIPNALMPAFTYTPYTAAAAVAAGFPAGICGVTEDCYTISVRQFQQNLGLVDEITRVPMATTMWGYGSSTNAPAVGPFIGGVWHAPGPTVKVTQGRPARITWVNELPNIAPPGLDPTADCGPNAPDCYPYNRLVTHVHGAHVDDDSDGNAVAWFTPNFAVTGPHYKPSPYGPLGTYRYRNDQEGATIWYHDHAIGTTHTNTQMGIAGFFPVKDANEQALIAAKIVPVDPYEIGFALQDRTFKMDGSIAMPDKPVRDLLSPLCLPDPILGGVIVESCPIVPFSKAIDGHLIPYDPNIADAALRGPFQGTSTTLEYFGNMPMVNGVVYGTYAAEPRFYRMRLIGGTDSRTWVVKLVSRLTGSVLPIWQIASEQGMLANPVRRDTFDLMPGERLDLLLDFRGRTVGEKIVMQNLGPDTPYSGPGNVAPNYPFTAIPEVMEFNMIALNPAVPEISLPTVTTNLRPLLGPIVPLVATIASRNVSLMEIKDRYGRTMPTIDSRGYLELTGAPVTELMPLGAVQDWNIINTTVDAHPMHLHLVAFQTISTQLFDPLSFVPPVTDMVNGIITQPTFTYAVGSVPVPPAAWEAGWKDTIDAPPGFVTRVRAKFDIPGLYLWHCHILSHEEHDMMRFEGVTIPATSVILTAATVTSPFGAPVTFTAQAAGLVGAVLTETNAFQYRFSITTPLGATFVMRDWGLVPGDPHSTFRNWTWNTPMSAGTYTITVNARQLGSALVNGEVSKTLVHTLLPNVALKTKIGVFAANTWYLDANGNGIWNGTPLDTQFSFGSQLAGAVPVTGDWTGSGTTKIGAFANGTWYLDLNGNGIWDGTPTDGAYTFGAGMAGAVPVTGDWTGSGTTKIGIYVNGRWYLDLNGNGAYNGAPTDGAYIFGLGMAGAVPVTGDWTGSGTTKIGVFVNGQWYLDLNGNGIWDNTPTDGLANFGTGLVGAQPVTGDWDGSGKTEIGVFSNGVWYIDLDGSKVWNGVPPDSMYSFGAGIPGVKPVVGRW